MTNRKLKETPEDTTIDDVLKNGMHDIKYGTKTCLKPYARVVEDVIQTWTYAMSHYIVTKLSM